MPAEKMSVWSKGSVKSKKHGQFSIYFSRPKLERRCLVRAQLFRGLTDSENQQLASAARELSCSKCASDERGLLLEEKLFSEQGRVVLEKLSLAPWASRRRQELLELLDRMNPTNTDSVRVRQADRQSWALDDRFSNGALTR